MYPVNWAKDDSMPKAVISGYLWPLFQAFLSDKGIQCGPAKSMAVIGFVEENMLIMLIFRRIMRKHHGFWLLSDSLRLSAVEGESQFHIFKTRKQCL